MIWGIHILCSGYGSERSATHDYVWGVDVVVAHDLGYHVTMEQRQVLPPCDRVPDRWQADLVFSLAVQTLGDVAIVDPTDGTLVEMAAHVAGYVTARAVLLKESAYAER